MCTYNTIWWHTLCFTLTCCKIFYIQQIPPKKPVKCSTFPFQTLRKSPQSTLLCASINISAVGCHVFIKYKYFVENKMSEMSSSYEPFQKAIISHFSCRFMTAGRKLFAMKIRLLHLKQFIILYLSIMNSIIIRKL